jgi:acetate---CoA ligase (ADP-forming)
VRGAARPRPESVGHEMVRQLLDGGFPGAVHLVNPRYDRVAGRPCHPSLDAVPGPVDLAVLAVPNERLEEQLRAAARLGVRAATIFASGLEAEAGDPPLAARLAALARDGGIVLCGPNCMGFVNFDRALRAVGFYEPL